MDRTNPNQFIKAENVRLRQENDELRAEAAGLRRTVDALEKLFDAADHFQSDEQLMPFLRRTLEQAMSVMNAPDGTLFLHDEESGELVFVIVLGQLSEQLSGHRIPSSQGIAGWVFSHSKPTLVRNTRTDPRFSSNVDQSFTFRTQSIAAAPIIGNRKTFGLIEVLNQPGDEPFSASDLALLRLLCRAAGEALADMEMRR